MTNIQRLTGFAAIAIGLAVFRFGPDLFGLDETGVMVLSAIAQLGLPLVAAIACLVAARVSRGGDRAAWSRFALGTSFYVLGNVLYLYYALNGETPDFPAAPEVCFFVMAILFTGGMFHYGRMRNGVTRGQFYDFILIYCALTLATLFILHEQIGGSVLSDAGTAVAFFYPSLWFSVAAFGGLSLLIRKHGRRTGPFAILLLAVCAEAMSDFLYARALLSGTYVPGGATQLLWVLSTALITFAAIEQIVFARRPAVPVSPMEMSGPGAALRAAVPGATMAILMLSGTLAGALPSGHYLWVGVVLSVAFAIVTGLREHWNIARQRQLRTTAEESEERLGAILESTTDSVMVIGRNWTIDYFNAHAVRTCRPFELRLGASFWETFPRMGERSERLYRDAVAKQQPVEFEEYYGDGMVWLEVHAYPLHGGLAIFFRDVSERRRAHEEIIHLAHHDALTGLANRVVFQERLKAAVDSGRPFAVVLLDLDHFKEVNDTLGHPIGDLILLETADRLRRCVGASDTIARLGGDEFAIIAMNRDEDAVRTLARNILEEAGAPFGVEDRSVRVGGSAGIAIASADVRDPDRLFRNADIALYAAKAEARGAFRFFEPEMEAGLQQRQALRTDLGAALKREQFELAYQPIVDLKTDTVCAFEALLRWKHPVHGFVPPDVFIPIAEDTGLIVAIGEWVLRTACREAMRWPESVSVAINLSTHQFANGDLITQIGDALEASGLEAERLELEITESVLLKDSRANLKTLNQIRDMGVRVALDDFGTGYSSLGYLQRFPFSKIKIDRSFISGLPASGESQAIVRSITGLGKSLGMRVTAEGVETAEQLQAIRSGCDEAQGYLLNRPVPAADVAAVLDRLGWASPEDIRLAG